MRIPALLDPLPKSVAPSSRAARLQQPTASPGSCECSGSTQVSCTVETNDCASGYYASCNAGSYGCGCECRTRTV